MTTKIQQRVLTLHYTQFEKVSSLTTGIENSPENTENKQSRIEKTTFIYLFSWFLGYVGGGKFGWTQRLTGLATKRQEKSTQNRCEK